MKFLDQAKIYVKGGDGGNGADGALDIRGGDGGAGGAAGLLYGDGGDGGDGGAGGSGLDGMNPAAAGQARALLERWAADDPLETVPNLRDDQMSPLFQAVRDATEEAVINSLLQATSMTGHEGHRVEAIDPGKLEAICRKHGAISADN